MVIKKTSKMILPIIAYGLFATSALATTTEYDVRVKGSEKKIQEVVQNLQKHRIPCFYSKHGNALELTIDTNTTLEQAIDCAQRFAKKGTPIPSKLDVAPNNAIVPSSFYPPSQRFTYLVPKANLLTDGNQNAEPMSNLKNFTLKMAKYMQTEYLKAPKNTVHLELPFDRALEYTSQIKDSATRYNIDPFMLLAISDTTSKFWSTSTEQLSNGDQRIGLFQIPKRTYSAIQTYMLKHKIDNTIYTKDLKKHPKNQINLAAYYLKYLNDRFSLDYKPKKILKIFAEEQLIDPDTIIDNYNKCKDYYQNES